MLLVNNKTSIFAKELIFNRLLLAIELNPKI